MMTSLALAVRSDNDYSTGAVAPNAWLGLPEAVEGSAWIAAIGDDLRILINRPGSGKTLQLCVRPDRHIVELEPLPCIAAGLAVHDQNIVITGASSSGQPITLGVSIDGRVTWRTRIDGPMPTRWPVPAYTPGPVILWQTCPESLEIAEVGPSGIGSQRSIAVGGPPLAMATTADAAWVAWLDVTGIRGVRIIGDTEEAFHQPMSRPGDLSIGSGFEHAQLAWVRGIQTLFARGPPFRKPISLALGDASGGTLSVISGALPLVWAQRGEAIDGQGVSWTSALTAPGCSPVMIDGLIHAVAWWHDMLVVLGTVELLFFKKTGTDALIFEQPTDG